MADLRKKVAKALSNRRYPGLTFEHTGRLEPYYKDADLDQLDADLANTQWFALHDAVSRDEVFDLIAEAREARRLREGIVGLRGRLGYRSDSIAQRLYDELGIILRGGPAQAESPELPKT
jgi:hypothetical protein